MASRGNVALAALLAGLGVVGFLATAGQAFRNGLGDVIADVLGARGQAEPAELLGAPAPVKRAFTGVEEVDRLLGIMVVFIAALVDDPGLAWSTWAAYVVSMGQFAAGWTLLVLEGRRSGNRGRAVSWVGTLGLVYQNVSWALAVPLYFALHLLTSPVARLDGRGARVSGDAARRSLFVYLWDIALIPMAVTLSFILPAIFICRPSSVSAATHYNLIAFWEPFPLWTVLALDVLHNTCYFLFGSLSPQDSDGKPTTPGKGFTVAVSSVYQFGITVAVITHAPVLLVSLLPGPLRSALISAFPKYAPFLSDVTFTRTFLPYPIYGQPIVNPAAYGPGDLSPLVADFLKYDLYIGNTSMLLWALYLNVRATGTSTWKAVRKAAFWTIVGGSAAGALALLWDRDEVVKEDDSEAKNK